MSRKSRVLDNLEYRRQRIIEGKINCIPSKLKRFRNDFIGIEQACYYCITSSTKGGKSQFTSDLFIFEPLLYCYYNRDKIDVSLKVLYFPLEETEERITERFISWLLYRLSEGKVRISPRDLRSTTKAVSQEILDIIKQKNVQDILDYFEQCVIIPDEPGNPTGILKYCVKYAEEHGTVHYKISKRKNALGTLEDYKSFDYYTPDNPNEYRLIIIDTINLIDTERGMNLKESMDKLSEYLAKYLRNRYYYSPVVIQQQAFSGESIDAFKLNKIRPTVAGLSDSKYISRDSNIVLGIFSPFKHGIPNCEGYDITKLRDNFRLLEVLVNRDGVVGGLCPLLFKGDVCTFEELPLPTETTKLTQIYNQVTSYNQGISLINYSKYLNKKNDDRITHRKKHSRKL